MVVMVVEVMVVTMVMVVIMVMVVLVVGMWGNTEGQDPKLRFS